MDLDKIEKLIELARKHGVHEIKVANDDDEVRVTINPPGGGAMPGYAFQAPMAQAPMPAPAPAPAPVAAAAAPASQTADAGPELDGKVIRSPFVGTFYRSPGPDQDPFVEVGAQVKKGQTLCIVEAMKLMNEIESEMEGVVKKILVDNEDPVEFDQPLFILE